jgi:hypothetical protein
MISSSVTPPAVTFYKTDKIFYMSLAGCVVASAGIFSGCATQHSGSAAARSDIIL